MCAALPPTLAEADAEWSVVLGGWLAGWAGLLGTIFIGCWLLAAGSILKRHAKGGQPIELFLHHERKPVPYFALPFWLVGWLVGWLAGRLAG